jgi:acetylglutamate kinase
MPAHTNRIILIKYGGNAMTDPRLKRKILQQIGTLSTSDLDVVLVHGGGPFIKNLLERLNIKSEFIDGQRKTSKEAITYIEMALKGQVNGDLVGIMNSLGYKSVGLSGKDGQIVEARKRIHYLLAGNVKEEIDLGFVGDIESINPQLIFDLLNLGYIPIITCIAADTSGVSYNINGDIMAGSIAGALQVHDFLLLTDVDGLLMDKDDPASLIPSITVEEITKLKQTGVIVGGMIPKVDACIHAVKQGASQARILNGTKPELLGMYKDASIGTTITL